MVVDDDESIRELMAEIVAGEGYTVLTAEDGEQALDLATTHDFALIFLDMRMPVMDGWAFARAYRETDGPHAPIVVMTAAQNAREWSDEVGGVQCMAKPFDLAAVFAALERHAP